MGEDYCKYFLQAHLFYAVLAYLFLQVDETACFELAPLAKCLVVVMEREAYLGDMSNLKRSR